MLLPHLDAAYNLARWLMKNEQDAKDVVQESYIRAFQFFGTWKGGADARPWLLTIVRNSCYTALRKAAPSREALEFDDDIHGEQAPDIGPEALLFRKLDEARVRMALEQLPVLFREILILNELEGLSYKEISEVTGVPLGTVMSRLSRARIKLKDLMSEKGKEASR